MDQHQKQLLATLLGNNKLATLSTISSDGTPQSALVAFAEDNDLNLYFQTRSATRKYANLTNNAKVSIVIGWSLDSLKTLQYEGNAVEVKGSAEIKDLFINKESPSTVEYLNHSDARFFKVTPTWLRYSDYSIEPPEIWSSSV